QKLNLGGLRWGPGGHLGGRRTEEVEPVPGRQSGRDRPEVGIELGDVVLSHGEEGPAAPVAQRDTELLQKGDPLVLAHGIEGEQLLELIEQQARIRTRWEAID